MKLARAVVALAVLATAACAFLARPAYAQGQMPHLNLIPDIPTKSQDEKDADEARDKAYKETLRKIPDARTSNDPWGGVRSNDAPKTTTTTKAAPGAKTTAATKKTKSSGTAN
jgi:hypothetical protein